MKKTFVIGAGIGGIASALRLKSINHDVKIFDRCKEIGGRAQKIIVDGYQHDTGPTVITAPYLFKELFKLFNEDIENYINFIPLNPWYRFYFDDFSFFDYGGTKESTVNEIKKFSSRDADGYLKMLESSKSIYEIGYEKLATFPFHDFSNMVKIVPDMIKLRSFTNVYNHVSKYIKNENLRKAFSIQPLLVGGNPFTTTSIYCLIHYLERKDGIHFPLGGTAQIVNQLKLLLIKNNIDIKNEHSLNELNIKNKKVISVKINNTELKNFDNIVYNGDPITLYKNILKGNISFKNRFLTSNVKISMGLYVLFFGTKVKYKDVPHHSIIFCKRFRELLSDIFNAKHLSNDFSLYLHRPTATDINFAPNDCDSFYVLSPVPNLALFNDWDSKEKLYRKEIINYLEKRLLKNLKQNIVHEFSMTPNDFENDYLSYMGSGFSLQPTLSQSAWFRYHNKTSEASNLYLVGAGTHPGAGLPGVLNSAKLLMNII